MLPLPDTIPAVPGRDPRLDLARGLMLLIIFVAHVPGNLWADYIPARFGFSSGAEIFVFVSGIASGIAFGGAFLKKGFAEGARRILRRMLQLYGAHLATIVVLGGSALLVDHLLGEGVLAHRYGLEWLRDNTIVAAIDFATLRYVPPFFDILPMYVVLLALVIPAMALARVSAAAVLGLSFLLWLSMQFGALSLPGDPVSGAEWYFNPFAWQFLFFLGFAFGIGWLRPPEAARGLFWLSAAVLVISVPLTFWGFGGLWGWVDTVHAAIYPANAITILAPARLLHFLALAYVAYSLVASDDPWLRSPRLAPLYSVGRNSFGCFLAGLGLSMLGGIAIDRLGHGWLTAHVVNIAGLALMLAAGWLLDRRRSRAASARRRSLSAVADHGREPAAVA